jgi:hypothetical protein
MTDNVSSSDRKEEFQSWLFYMDDALDQFKAQLPHNLSTSLNFTPASLDGLEAWLLSRYNTIAELRAPDQVATLDGAARYVGETLRKALGGRWQIRFDDPKDAYYGLPELSQFGIPVPPICPHRLVTASIDRRTGQYLSTMLRNTQQLHQTKRASS